MRDVSESCPGHVLGLQLREQRTKIRARLRDHGHKCGEAAILGNRA